MKQRTTYYTWAHNIDGCLGNGSFVRHSRFGLGQFMNGDFMGFIEEVPEGMTEVDELYAKTKIPECCR